MSLFGKKTATTAQDNAVEVTTAIFADEKYREELREIGRQQFKELINGQSEHVQQEIDTMLERVTSDLQVQAGRRIEAMVGSLNDDITSQLNDRIKEYNRVSAEAQELMGQSLTRNAQMIHEKYQELSLSLQRVVANQEVAMATVFQDSKTQVTAIQAQQAKVLEQLRQSEETTRRESEELTAHLKETVMAQAAKLGAVYDENMSSVETTRDRQAAMLENLSKTTRMLEDQYGQLKELLDSTIDAQKAMVAQVISDNMARIIEHYLIAAFGEQSNIREQLPSILEQMEENKQAMVDDMKL